MNAACAVARSRCRWSSARAGTPSSTNGRRSPSGSASVQRLLERLVGRLRVAELAPRPWRRASDASCSSPSATRRSQARHAAAAPHQRRRGIAGQRCCAGRWRGRDRWSRRASSSRTVSRLGRAPGAVQDRDAVDVERRRLERRWRAASRDRLPSASRAPASASRPSASSTRPPQADVQPQHRVPSRGRCGARRRRAVRRRPRSSRKNAIPACASAARIRASAGRSESRRPCRSRCFGEREAVRRCRQQREHRPGARGERQRPAWSAQPDGALKMLLGLAIAPGVELERPELQPREGGLLLSSPVSASRSAAAAVSSSSPAWRPRSSALTSAMSCTTASTSAPASRRAPARLHGGRPQPALRARPPRAPQALRGTRASRTAGDGGCEAALEQKLHRMRREQGVVQHVVGQAPLRDMFRQKAPRHDGRIARRAFAANAPQPRVAATAAPAAPLGGTGGGSARARARRAGAGRAGCDGARRSSPGRRRPARASHRPCRRRTGRAPRASTAAAISSGLAVAAASRISWWRSVAASSRSTPAPAAAASRTATHHPSVSHATYLASAGDIGAPAPQRLGHLGARTTRGPRPRARGRRLEAVDRAGPRRSAPSRHRGRTRRRRAARCGRRSRRSARSMTTVAPSLPSTSRAASSPASLLASDMCTPSSAPSVASHWRSNVVFPDPASAAIVSHAAAIGDPCDALHERLTPEPWCRPQPCVGLAPTGHGMSIIAPSGRAPRTGRRGWRSPAGGEGSPPVRRATFAAMSTSTPMNTDPRRADRLGDLRRDHPLDERLLCGDVRPRRILNDEVVNVGGGKGAVVLDFTTWGWVTLILGSMMALTGHRPPARATARHAGSASCSRSSRDRVVRDRLGVPAVGALVITLDVVIIYQLIVNWRPDF